MLNLDLLRSPLNWLTAGTMVILGLFVIHYSLALIHGPTVTPKHPSLIV
jgi:hypothetical protein